MREDFSRTLSLLRQERGISQRKAAGDLGISQALLSHYENGVREPGLNFVTKACDYYRVSADFMLGRTLSRDGAIIAGEDLYDASEEKGNVLRGSVMATLQKKLIVNTVCVLFDLLGKLNNKDVIMAASTCLSTALYQLMRTLYRAAGENESFFLTSQTDFDAGRFAADQILCQAKFTEAVVHHDGAFPAMSDQELSAAYPGLSQSVVQVLHGADERIVAQKQ